VALTSITAFTATAILSLPGRAQTSLGTGKTFVKHVQTIGTTPDSVFVNPLVGATTFYDAGYTGTSTIVANIEGGFFWDQHQALRTNVAQLPVGAGGLGQYDGHATWVTDAIGGRPIGDPSDPRRGIAYGATLWGGALATSFNGGGFEVNDASFFTPYTTALLTGMNGRLADVTNSSFGYNDPLPTANPPGTGTNVSGADSFTVALDGIAAQSGRTVVFSAGNEGTGGNSNNRVNDPAGGYNVLSVGALTYTDYGTGTGPFSIAAPYTSGGPSDYQGPVNPSQPGGTVTQAERVSNVRARVDIVAPGDPLTLASFGPTDTSFSGPLGGTSFAAPIVAGGAALLVDVGNTLYGGFSTHGNIIKAVLLNSADHTIPGYNNGQTLVDGVVTTTQALDYIVGAGRLDLAQAFTQYTGGVTDVAGLGGEAGLSATGWDFGEVGAGGRNDYFLGAPLVGGTTFTATLNWFVNRTYAGLTNEGVLNTTPILDANGFLIADPNDLGFVNLNLELWRVLGGVPTNMVALSSAAYINTQHFFLDIPETGEYLLRVSWAGERYDVNGNIDSQRYGLAWSGTGSAVAVAAPEPTPVALLVSVLPIAAGLLLRRRRRSS
jgi:hypothetical protein